MRAGVILVGSALLIGSVAAADGPAGCTRDKLSAAARAVHARMACQVAAVRTGGAVDGECVQRALGRLSVAFEGADRRGPCPGSATDVTQDVVGWLALLLERVPGSGACSARKLAAAGRKVARRLECQRRDPGRVLDCFVRADARFVAQFMHADRDGPCAGDAGTVQTVTDDFAVSVGAPIAGPPPSTTSTTSTTLAGTCGNGVVDPGEQCDGQSYCTTECQFGPTACCLGSADAAFCVDFHPSRQSCLSCIGAGHGACVAGVCAGLGCTDQAIPPVHVCCQTGGGCATDVVSSIAELGAVYSDCAGQGFPFGIGICGVDRICHPGG